VYFLPFWYVAPRKIWQPCCWLIFLECRVSLTGWIATLTSLSKICFSRTGSNLGPDFLEPTFAQTVKVHFSNFKPKINLIRQIWISPWKCNLKPRTAGEFESDQGVDVMITVFCDFDNFWRQKLAFFSKTNVMINFLHNLALFWVKSTNFSAEFFWWKYLKNHNIGPRLMPRSQNIQWNDSWVGCKTRIVKC
jgi:hypothetical protein